MTTAAVSFTCDLCGSVTVEVPLDRPVLVALGCRDEDRWVAVGQTGRDMHGLEHLILAGGPQ